MPPTSPTSKDVFGVTTLTSRHPDIRRLKRLNPTRLHGNKSWSANYLLMDYLHRQPPPLAARVIDIGCGWGQAGILCAKHYQAEVIAIDADAEVFPYLDLHARHNQVKLVTQQARFDELDTADLANINLLIAADICFWDELAESVYQLVARACAAGVDKIIIADPGRPPFWEVAEHCADEFYAEVQHSQIDTPRHCSGALLIIENA